MQQALRLKCLGAVAGVLAGCLPNVLTICFADRIYSLLFALVPLAGMWCYRKCRGRMDGAAVAILVVLSLLSVFPMQLLSAGVYLVREYGTTAAQAAAILRETFLNADGLLSLAAGSLQLFLFMGLGLWLSWSYMARTNNGRRRQSEARLATLRPRSGAAMEE